MRATRRSPAPPLPLRPRGAHALALALAVALGAAVGCGEGDGAGTEARASLSVTETLAGGDTAGFARADWVRPLRFPADHGPHPSFRTEWWYYTGNLEADDGRRFGFQLTFFRSAIRPDTPAVASAWATRQLWMGHFALTDVRAGRFRAFERFDRGALGLAGARAEPFRVWIGDWEAAAAEAEPAGGPGSPWTPVRVRAGAEAAAVDLVLTAAKPVVLQGDRGLSRKGPEPGNASYYYSLTRLAAEGRVMSAGDTVPVTGWAWLDREWSTSALGPELAGWDWFALQLSDGSDLMVYRLRRRDGGTDPFSAGTLVGPGGDAVRLGPDDFVLEATGAWTSPRGGRYPSGWRVAVPSRGLRLTVEPVLADQELDLTFRYWEGAVAVTGERDGRPVRGRGYVELTGYGEAGGRRTGRGPGVAP